MQSLPYVEPTPGPVGPMLVDMAKRNQERDQNAAQNLLGKQRNEIDKQRLEFDKSRAEAEKARADAMEKRAAAEEAAKQAAALHAKHLEAAGALKELPGMMRDNPELGKAYGGIFGFNLNQDAPPADPGAAPAQPQAPSFMQAPAQQAAQQIGTGNPMQQAMGAANLAQATQPAQGPTQPPAQGAPPDPAAVEALKQQQERMQFAQQLAEHPQKVAEHGQHLQAFQQAKANPTYSGTGPFGQVHIDPRATAEARLAEIKQAYGGDTPQIQQMAMQMAGLGMDPKGIADAVNKQRAARAGFDEKDYLANKFQTTADQKFQMGMANANAHSLSARAGAAGKEDAASARAQMMLDRALGHAEKMTDFKGLVGMDNTMRGLMANIDSPNVLQKRDAQIQLGRLFRGTTPTEGEMHLLYTNLGGTADKWNQIVADLESGGLSDEQSRQLKASAQTAHHELDQRKTRTFDALKGAFGPGTGFEMLAPQVNAQLKARGKLLGVDVPDIYDSAETPKGGAVLLGSRAKKGGAKGNPMVDSAKFSKLAPADQSAVMWARSHKEDPRAAAILDHNGM